MDGVLAPLLAVVVAISAASLLQWAMTRVGGSDGAGPNRLVGIRTRATLASDEAWRAGHEAAQPGLLAAAVLGLVLAPALAVWGVAAGPSPVRTAVAVAAVVGVLGLFGSAVRRADRAARHATDGRRA